MKNTSEDKFEITGNSITVTSKSGNIYDISLDSCTCKGFGFHRTCRHFQQALDLGLIERLKYQPKHIDLSLSENAHRMRKDAIRIYLSKHGLNPQESVIDYIESKMNISTTPQQVLDMANGM